MGALSTKSGYAQKSLVINSNVSATSCQRATLSPGHYANAKAQAQLLMKKNLLFLCTGNSCRSQMAEAWLRHLKPTQFNAYSAGIEQHGLNAMAVQVMAEVDVDMSNHHSKSLDDLSDIKFDYVITVCGHAHETCPYFPVSAQVIHVGFDDPPKRTQSMTDSEEILKCYRRVRDEIKEFVVNIEQHLNNGE